MWLACEPTGLKLRFPNPTGFAFALEPWTNLPTTRFAKILAAPPLALLDEAAEIKAFTARLRRLFPPDMNSPSEFFSEFRALELHAFTHDFGWRSLIRTLTNASPKFVRYGEIAIQRYVEYLDTRESISRAVALMFGATNANVGADPQPKCLVGPGVTSERPRGVTYGLHQVRLPKNRPVEIDLPCSDRLTIALADYSLQIRFDQKWIVSLPNGRIHVLDASCYSVGRDSTCRIVIDSTVSSVSRRHLIIEPLSDTKLRLTDCSSLGSYLDPRWLMRRLVHEQNPRGNPFARVEN